MIRSKSCVHHVKGTVLPYVEHDEIEDHMSVLVEIVLFKVIVSVVAGIPRLSY